MESFSGNGNIATENVRGSRDEEAALMLEASSMSMWSWVLSQLSWLSDYINVLYTGAFLFGVCLIGVCTFMHFEKLSLVDAIYVTVVSATTVGFGDINPSTWQTKLIMTFWLLVATLTVAKLVTDQSDAFVRSKQRSVARRLLNANMDFRSLHKMDADGDGKVTRAEFLATCIVHMGKADADEVKEILARFDQLDYDKSGVIDRNECSNNGAM